MSTALAQLSDSFVLLVQIAKQCRLGSVARVFTREKLSRAYLSELSTATEVNNNCSSLYQTNE